MSTQIMQERLVKVWLVSALLLSLGMKLHAQEAYAALNEDNTVLTFYYDDQKIDRSGFDIGPFSYNDERWGGHSSEITTVMFDDTFANYSGITSTGCWFKQCNNLTKVIGIGNLDTSNVTYMGSMFYDCFKLDSLDLSSFNTSNVTNFSVMFYRCSSLSFLDVSKFNTSNVTDFTMMFSGCEALTSLDVSGFDTSKAKSMNGMFNDCISLTAIDVSNFDTSNVTGMSCMFGPCFNLASIDVSNFDTSNVTDMSSMFYRCDSLTSLNLSNFNTEKVVDMYGMFQGCKSLTTLDLSSFDTKEVTNMTFMFADCSALTTIYVKEGWNTANEYYGNYMFSGCENLVGGNGTRFNPLFDDYSYAWIDGVDGRPGYFTDIATASMQGVKIVADQDAKWYTLDGRHALNHGKGIFIKDKRKVLIR